MKIVAFMFTGTAVVPVAVTFAGSVQVAALTFCPLLMTACLIAAAKGDLPSVDVAARDSQAKQLASNLRRDPNMARNRTASANNQ
jgi:hypothetical protein